MPTIRLLFYNTFLLRIVELPSRDGPKPIGGAPVPAARAEEIAGAVAGSYEVAAFAEVFDRREKDTILSIWKSRCGKDFSAFEGPSGFGPIKSSGLFTLVSSLRVRRAARHRFRARGVVWRDSDSYANKGVSMLEIDPGIGSGGIEIYSTHLIYGNDLLRRPGHPYVACSSIRERQIGEILSFIDSQHDPRNVMVLVGDMNIPAVSKLVDPPDLLYLRMMRMLETRGFEDRWPKDGSGPGVTSGLDRPDADAIARPDQYDERFVADDTDELPEGAGERIDYFFLEKPSPAHQLVVHPLAFRRRAFPRSPDAVGFSRLRYCSDHMGLHIELEVLPKEDRSEPV